MATFTLTPRPPFRLDLTVWALRRLAANQMDRWDGETYRRVLVLGGGPFAVEVLQSGSELTVRTSGGRLPNRARSELIAILETTLGLNLDLTPFYKIAGTDRRLASFISPFVGLKPPRLPSIFEALLNGIACQQVSLAAGIQLLNRLCRAHGLHIGEAHAFPRPADIATAALEQLRALGLSTRKAQTMIDIARSVTAGQLDLKALSSCDDAAVQERLIELKGVGRWTAQYVLLRGLGRLDVFPADDVGGQSKLQQWLGSERRPGYDEVNRILAPWQPYRGLIYFYLLLDHQRRLGLLRPAPPLPGS